MGSLFYEVECYTSSSGKKAIGIVFSSGKDFLA